MEANQVSQLLFIQGEIIRNEVWVPAGKHRDKWKQVFKPGDNDLSE